MNAEEWETWARQAAQEAAAALGWDPQKTLDALRSYCPAYEYLPPQQAPYTCPVCRWDGLEEPPRDYSICPRCGVEFGRTDRTQSHADVRARWEAAGCPWFDPASRPEAGMERITALWIARDHRIGCYVEDAHGQRTTRLCTVDDLTIVVADPDLIRLAVMALIQQWTRLLAADPVAARKYAAEQADGVYHLLRDNADQRARAGQYPGFDLDPQEKE